jgi:hypothetical protein
MKVNGLIVGGGFEALYKSTAWQLKIKPKLLVSSMDNAKLNIFITMNYFAVRLKAVLIRGVCFRRLIWLGYKHGNVLTATRLAT